MKVGEGPLVADESRLVRAELCLALCKMRQAQGWGKIAHPKWEGTSSVG